MKEGMEVINSQKVKAPREQTFNAVLNPEVFKQSMFAELTALASDISRLSPTDADLFRKAFQKEEICYAKSWLYILRSTRNDQGGFGYKFVGKETLLGIGYRNNTIYLVHPIGTGRFNTTLDLCYKIHDRIKCPIILKKIDQELYEQLYSTKLFRELADDLMLFEEEAFPENILQLKKLFSTYFGMNSQSIPLLKKVKRFEKSSIKLLAKLEVSEEEIKSNPGFQNLFGQNSYKYKSYMQIIREASSLRPSDGRYKVCAYYDEHKTIHGLYIAELLEKDSMGLYCAVSSKSFPGITEWMDYDFFQQMFNEGIHYLYLGGSETKGVDAYIKKLLPIAPSYLMRPMGMCYKNDAGPVNLGLFS